MANNREVLTPTQSPPMHERRPPWLRSAIDARFEWVRSSDGRTGPKVYHWNGILDNYEFFFAGDPDLISTIELLDHMEERRSEPLRILDIGTGAGTFVLNCLRRGHFAHGISAHDYRDTKFGHVTKQIPKSAYIIADANNLSAIPGIYNEYDLVVSHSAFVHFVDPLGTLEQAVNMLAPSGVAVTTAIDVGASGFYKARQTSPTVTPELIMSQLAESGLRTGGSVHSLCTDPNRIVTVFAQRSGDTEELRLPIGYEGEPNSWQYTYLANEQAA
jgi:ubiquinone/menaquinone biosynthesis C-methylase UbiE